MKVAKVAMEFVLVALAWIVFGTIITYKHKRAILFE